MTEFLTTRQRDAWATIRGFVYQVDLTISRWMALPPGAVLELERGEDIDHLARAFQNNERIVEQIKVRQRPLTLNSSSFREALANFVEHRQANPSQSLTFRFTTNTRLGVERPPLFGKGIPALRTWNDIREVRVASDEALASAETLKMRLLTAPRPKALDDGVWERFRTVLSEADGPALLSLIQSFEIGAAATPPEELGPAIERAILDCIPGLDRESARTRYHRLFVFVIKLLTRAGLKQLTSDELDREIAAGSVELEDTPLAQQIRWVLEMLSELKGRIENVEANAAHADARLDIHDARLATSEAAFAAMRKELRAG